MAGVVRGVRAVDAAECAPGSRVTGAGAGDGRGIGFPRAVEDAESEHLIQNAIERLMLDRTTFVIAHRFSTILAADTIVVMEAGRIVGQGKHDELMRDCATYSGLYERQLMPA